MIDGGQVQGWKVSKRTSVLVAEFRFVRAKFRFVRWFIAVVVACQTMSLGAMPSLASSIPEYEFQRLVDACDEAVSAKNSDPVDTLALAKIEDLSDDVFGGYARVEGKVVRVLFKHSKMFSDPAPFLTTCIVWGVHDEIFSPSEVLLWERAKVLAAESAVEKRKHSENLEITDEGKPGFLFLKCGSPYSTEMKYEPTKRPKTVVQYSDEGTVVIQNYSPNDIGKLEARYTVNSLSNRVFGFPMCEERR